MSCTVALVTWNKKYHYLDFVGFENLFHKDSRIKGVTRGGGGGPGVPVTPPL